MAWPQWRSLAAGLLRRPRLESELSDELQFHLEARTRDLMARGLSAESARRTARIEFGSIERYKDEVRSARGLGFFDELRTDLVNGMRALRRAPGFTLAAALSLALGIGANTLVFSLLDSTVLKPVALPQSDRLVAIWTVPPGQPDQLGTSSISRFTAFRDYARSFESVAAFNGIACGTKTLGFERDGMAPERILGQTVSPGMFRTLGVQPIMGRTFTEAEDVVDQVAPVALISHAMWQRRFNGDPEVVGKTLILDRTTTTIIGVLPSGFDFFGTAREFFAPLCLTRAQVEGRNGGNSLIGRLKPGVTVAQAQAELEALTARLAVTDPHRHQGLGVRVESLTRAGARTLDATGQPTSDYASSLTILQGAVALVLLIACANVAGLLLARGATRRAELALRMTLGAGKWRVVRQVLTECLPLALLGAAIGTALAWAGLKAFMLAAPADFPRIGQVSLDLRVLAFTAAVVVVTAALFALVPALQASRVTLVEASRESGRSSTGSRERRRMRSALVCGQVALAMVLLVGAGLLIHSFVRVIENELGADPTNLLTFDFRLPPRETFKGAGVYRGSGLFEINPAAADTFDRVRERLQRLPGVQSVAAATVGPFGTGLSLQMPFTIEGRPAGLRGGRRQTRGPADDRISGNHARLLQGDENPGQARPGLRQPRPRRLPARRHRQRYLGASLLSEPGSRWRIPAPRFRPRRAAASDRGRGRRHAHRPDADVERADRLRPPRSAGPDVRRAVCLPARGDGVRRFVPRGTRWRSFRPSHGLWPRWIRPPRSQRPPPLSRRSTTPCATFGSTCCCWSRSERWRRCSPQPAFTA